MFWFGEVTKDHPEQAALKLVKPSEVSGKSMMMTGVTVAMAMVTAVVMMMIVVMVAIIKESKNKNPSL